MTTKKSDESKTKKAGFGADPRTAGKSGERQRSGAPVNPFESMFKSWQDFANQMLMKSSGQSPKSITEFWQQAPEMMEQTGKAGTYLKDLREVAGLTHEDLARAIDLENPDLLRAIEEGRAPVTIDILYRLASFHSRNDPVTFMVEYSRKHAPLLWYSMQLTGMDKFLITIERELKFVNIYRSRDAARQLSNEQFQKLVDFMAKAFDLALDLIAIADPDLPPETKTVQKPPQPTPAAPSNPE